MPSKRKIYLIDYENVSSDWAEYIPSMTASTRILLFYSAATPAVQTKVLSQILAKKVKLELIQCITGVSAMDFQLVTELGYRIGTAQPSAQPVQYYIVSRDKGFDAVVNYWSGKGIAVARLSPVHNGQATYEPPEHRPVQAPPPEKHNEPPAIQPVQTSEQVKKPKQTHEPEPSDVEAYISPASAKNLNAWRKRLTACVNSFGHIPPKPKNTLLQIMLTAPSIHPQIREAELSASINTLVNKTTDYTGGRPWNKMKQLLNQLDTIEHRQADLL